MATSSAPREGQAGKAVPLTEPPAVGQQPNGTATRTTSCPKASTCSTSYILRQMLDMRAVLQSDTKISAFLPIYRTIDRL